MPALATATATTLTVARLIFRETMAPAAVARTTAKAVPGAFTRRRALKASQPFATAAQSIASARALGGTATVCRATAAKSTLIPAPRTAVRVGTTAARTQFVTWEPAAARPGGATAAAA